MVSGHWSGRGERVPECARPAAGWGLISATAESCSLLLIRPATAPVERDDATTRPAGLIVLVMFSAIN